MDEREAISNLLFVPGGLLLLAAWWARHRTRVWLRGVVRTEGTIVAYREDVDPDSGAVWYYAVYRYAGVENDHLDGGFQSPTPPVTGAKAMICHDRNDRMNAFLEGSRKPMVLPGCMFIIGMAVIVWAVVVRFGNVV